MALQAHQFLVHTYLVRIDRHFLQDPAVIDHSVTDQFLHFFIQTLPVGRDNLRRFLGDEIDVALHLVELADQVISEEFALTHARVAEILGCFADYAAKGLPERLRIRGLLFHGEYVGKSGQRGYPDIILDPELLGHLTQIRKILSCDLVVVLDVHIGFFEVFVGDIDVDLATINIILELRADTGFQHAQLSGHLDPDIQIAVIDGLDLDCDLQIVVRKFCSSISCHTLDHRQYSSILMTIYSRFYR